MKKSILILVLALTSIFTFAQNEKYVSMMEKTVAEMEAAKTAEDYQKAANVFERISNAEGKEWLPAYYNALCNVNLASLAMRGGESDKIVPFVDKAQTALDQCIALVPNESEVFALQGFIYTSRIWADPMNGGATFSPMAHKAFGQAIALDAKNPRAYYLRGQLVFYTPEFWGGGPKNAHKDLAAAAELFKSFEPNSSIHPNWGIGGNAYHLGKAEETVKKEKEGK